MNSDRELILSMIDEATEPGRMDPAAAVTFLEELHVDIECRIDALREENPELEEQ
jgi:hypothetical protein